MCLFNIIFKLLHSPLQTTSLQRHRLPAVGITDPNMKFCNQKKIQYFTVTCKNPNPECIRQCTLKYFAYSSKPKMEKPYNFMGNAELNWTFNTTTLN